MSLTRRRFVAAFSAAALSAAGPRIAVGGPDDAYLRKMARFDEDHLGDVFLPPDELGLLDSVASRLARVQKIVGHGHFHTLGFDEMLAVSRGYSVIGRFPADELAFEVAVGGGPVVLGL